LENRVVFYSGLSDSALAWLYRNCDVFVTASSIEGFCLPLVEAMQLSRRVVCSDIPVFREIANARCAFFSLDGHATDNLAGAIVRALFAEAQTIPADTRFSRQNASRMYDTLYSRMTRRAVQSLDRAAS
jgi:glycosyltransferase involved in cell wall biosynthesis